MRYGYSPRSDAVVSGRGSVRNGTMRGHAWAKKAAADDRDEDPSSSARRVWSPACRCGRRVAGRRSAAGAGGVADAARVRIAESCWRRRSARRRAGAASGLFAWASVSTEGVLRQLPNGNRALSFLFAAYGYSRYTMTEIIRAAEATDRRRSISRPGDPAGPVVCRRFTSA